MRGKGNNELQEEIKKSLRERERYEKLTLVWKEKLIDPVTETVLKQAAQYLTPQDYQDIVEERVLIQRCGYPLCGNKCKKSDQKYKISLRERKVYRQDVNVAYCSRKCAIASKFYASQLAEDPVYVRSRDGRYSVNVVIPADVQGAEKERYETLQQHGSKSDTPIEWYISQLLSNLYISGAGPQRPELDIIEHQPGEEQLMPDTPQEDANNDGGGGNLFMAKYQTIDGFEPTFDAKQLKDSIRRVRMAGTATPSDKPKGRSVAAKPAHPTNAAGEVKEVPSRDLVGGVIERVEASKESDEAPCVSGGSSSSSSSSACVEAMFGLDDDEDEDEEDNIIPAKPSLSMFGQMWVVVDRMITAKTVSLMNAMKKICALPEQMTEYVVAADDPALLLRHSLFFDRMSGWLSKLARSEDKTLSNLGLRHELYHVVNSLQLDTSSAVLPDAEFEIVAAALTLGVCEALRLSSSEMPTKMQEFIATSGGPVLGACELSYLAQRMFQTY
ncbi:hypothetical protein EV182_000312 [Spiromyces aspiralis]|uniref:Uncharacterized protein n=1 Tax=Spiromyces aspiralis TaxID=68401 RepID=A0ACC1HKL9_9FUNG|nr:hypothetical protein EV182_000312 [Spiromyces aspiralis]